MAPTRDEFDLAVRCCKANFVGYRKFEALLVRSEIDWNRFLRIVRFHRVEGLVWAALRQARAGLPDNVATSLARDARQIAASSLQAAQSSKILLEAFERAGCPLLFFKGLTVGSLAYANPAVKRAVDVDLLIDPKDVETAGELLFQAGYRLIIPEARHGKAGLRAWHWRSKESVWEHERTKVQVDLHTRLTDSFAIIPELNVHSPRQMVDVGGGTILPTFADEELFAYLAVHGGWSAWFRLKWIADFAGLVSARGLQDVERLYRRSQDLGAGRSAGQALLVADRLFGTLEENPGLAGELRADAALRRLERRTNRFLTRDPAEPTESFLGTLPIHLSHFDLLPGYRARAAEVANAGWRGVRRLAARSGHAFRRSSL